MTVAPMIPARSDSISDVRFARALIILNGAVPFVILGWDALHHNLGVDGVNYAIKTTGLLALIFLPLSLLITPLRKLTGWNWLILFRRSLGLYAFFYALTHFLIFFIFDRGGSVSGTLSEMVKRKYLIVGTIGLVAMMPLAVTSTNAMVRRLGAKKWHLLHRLAYVAVAAGAIHYYMQAKADKRQPLAFMAVIGVLLAYRVVNGGIWLARWEAALGEIPIATRRVKFWKGKLRVASVSRETPTVQTFRLEAVDGGEFPFDYQPGQYLNLSLPIDGKKVNRSYTIASSPTRKGHCELTIKREDMGVASRHFHDTIKVGDVIDVSAPSGHFTFDEMSAGSIVLIGGGVGITPLMSVIRALTDNNWNGDIYLIYSAKTRDEIIFGDELADLARRHPNFHLTITLTRDTPADWQGSHGRISPELLRDAVPNIARCRVHVCGPFEMMGPVKIMLHDLGVPDENVKSEAFEYANTGSEARPIDEMTADDTEAAAVAHEITFVTSGKSFTAKPGMTVLEASEEAGVDIPFDCRSGICATCKTRMTAGRVRMDVKDALSAAEEASGLILACQAHPLTDCIVQA